MRFRGDSRCGRATHGVRGPVVRYVDATPARVERRSMPAGGNRPSPGGQTTVDRGRRIGIRSRRVNSGADSEFVRRAATGAESVNGLYLA